MEGATRLPVGFHTGVSAAIPWLQGYRLLGVGVSALADAEAADPADLIDRSGERRAWTARRDDRASDRSRDPVWILEQGLVDWKTFRKIAPMLASGGDVYTVRSLGSAKNDRVRELVTARIDRARGTYEVIFRTTQPPVRLTSPPTGSKQSLSSRGSEPSRS